MKENMPTFLKQLAQYCAAVRAQREVVVHDLESGDNAEHSIVAIENGRYARKVGDGPSHGSSGRPWVASRKIAYRVAAI